MIVIWLKSDYGSKVLFFFYITAMNAIFYVFLQ